MQELQTADVGVETIDVLIMGAYLVLILTVGTVVSRMASKNLDSYFLGGRKLPWWLLGLSGTACYFDVAGVMWTISLFYTMGQPDAPAYATFPALLVISLVTSVVATLLSRPVDQDVIEGFYGRVRPFGYWGPVKRLVAKPGEEFARESAAADILTALVTAIGLQALFLVATYACTHQTGACSIASAVVALSGLCVYFSWYRKLPAE